LEDKGLSLIAMKMIHISKNLAYEHYEIHKDKPFFDTLIKFVTSSPVIVSAWKGKNAIKIIRNLVGSTNPQDATPGSIRGDFALDTTYNIIHASDATETAKKEIALFFNEDEIFNYTHSLDVWLKPE
jgi:nucleoside-diphosphate kinase